MLAIVIDPIRTMASGKVEIGAFRTYPDDYKPASNESGRHVHQTVPLDKIEDFGVHFQSYYALEVSYFKNSVDNQLLEVLWNKYWINTIT